MRHLHAEPVSTQPPDLVYRAGRFAWRNRTGVSHASIVLLAGAGFTGQTVMQTRQREIERDRAPLAAELAMANGAMQKALLRLMETKHGDIATRDAALDDARVFTDSPRRMLMS